MRIVYAYMKSGETIRFEIEDEWTMTFGTAAGNRGMGLHELRVYSDGKKNQRAAFTNVVTFWEEGMTVQRVLIEDKTKGKKAAKPSTAATITPGQLSTEDYPELYEDDDAEPAF